MEINPTPQQVAMIYMMIPMEVISWEWQPASEEVIRASCKLTRSFQKRDF